MNANQIVNMVVRTVMRRLMSKGINAGMDAVGRRMSKGRTPKATEPEMRGDAGQMRATQSPKLDGRLRKF